MPTSIVVGRKGSAGSVSWFDVPVWATDTAYWAEPLNQVTPRFAHLLLQYANLPSICAQTGVPGLNRDRAYEIPVLLPPLPEQRRIVDLIGGVDNATKAAQRCGAGDLYAELLEEWSQGRVKRRLGDALNQVDDHEPVLSSRSYRIVGVARSGAGFIDRGPVNGGATSYSRLNRLKEDELVYRKLTAWEGPISVTTSEEAGGWVSNEFPVFKIDSSVLRPALVRHVCRWPGLWERMGAQLVGSVQRRKRLNPADLMAVQVSMPSLTEQDMALELLNAAWSAHQDTGLMETRLRLLRNSLLSQLLSGEHLIPATYDETLTMCTVVA